VEQRCVLVTGAGRGVGKACAERFVSLGWKVVAGVRDLARARDEYADNPALRLVQLDVTDHDQIRVGLAEALAFCDGRIDCLVNNAGYALMGAQEDADLAEVRAMFETNFFGAAAVTQAVLPVMRAAGGGSVIQVSSIGDRLTNPLLGFYHASKYAMLAASEALAAEGHEHGIRVSVIEPGMIDTDFPKATRVSGSLMSPEGPYALQFAELRASFGAWRAMEVSSADDVAEVITTAATEPDPPFRIVVGLDGQALARARAESDDPQAWKSAFTRFLHR
jgi:NAD(P)-dependent dehydrogenase (short-subunit alcohol dehydrogenase family)